METLTLCFYRIFHAFYDLISQQPSYEREYNITLFLVKENLQVYIKTIPIIDDIPFKLRLIELFINDNTISILGLHYTIYVNNRDDSKRSKQIDIFGDNLSDYSKPKNLGLIKPKST